ncbi:MAG: alpha/beta hydrolase [Pirellulales bacterium]
MNLSYRSLFACSLIALTLIAPSPAAAEPKTEPLWPAGPPGKLGEGKGHEPNLTFWLPPADKAQGTAIVVCPGGGYGHLAVDHEGKQIGQWLNSLGIAAAVLEYRHSAQGYRHPIPLGDAQRAIRTLRARAKELKIDPAKIGILGFSAGGHLASTASTKFDAGKPDAADPIERVSSRPDFAVLVYPVISFVDKSAHQGSARNLLGEKATAEQLAGLSNETQVTADTPPTFLMHTGEDTGVPPENSVLYYLALRKAGVPAELHIYEKGAHGQGLAPKTPGTRDWPKACAEWLKGRGLKE